MRAIQIYAPPHHSAPGESCLTFFHKRTFSSFAIFAEHLKQLLKCTHVRGNRFSSKYFTGLMMIPLKSKVKEIRQRVPLQQAF